MLFRWSTLYIRGHAHTFKKTEFYLGSIVIAPSRSLCRRQQRLTCFRRTFLNPSNSIPDSLSSRVEKFHLLSLLSRFFPPCCPQWHRVSTLKSSVNDVCFSFGRSMRNLPHTLVFDSFRSTKSVRPGRE